MGQIEQFPVPLQEYIKPLHEAISLVGIVAGDVLEVAPHEDQAAGATLAFGGGDAGLGAADLVLEGFLPVTLGVQQFFFLSLSSCLRASCRVRSCFSSSCG